MSMLYPYMLIDARTLCLSLWKTYQTYQEAVLGKKSLVSQGFFLKFFDTKFRIKAKNACNWGPTSALDEGKTKR